MRIWSRVDIANSFAIFNSEFVRHLSTETSDAEDAFRSAHGS